VKLLIADDVDLNLKLLRAQLEYLGHEVVQAADGVEALAILERERVDGIVSDILMPRMDGYRFCMELRQRPDIGDLPFVLYTSTYNSPGDRKLAESVGADAFIAKPAPIDRIISALLAAADSRLRGNLMVSAINEPAPIMKQYNEVLVRKLEEKGLALARAHEGLVQTNRVYAVLSEINSLIVRVADRDELLQQACRILIGTGHFSKAWIGLAGEGIAPVRILAWAGAPDAFFEDLQQRFSSRAPGSPGLLARTLDSGQPSIANDIANDPAVHEKAKLLDSGSRSFALFPLLIGGRTVGILSIHSSRAGFFDAEETRLLLGLANDISFALDHLLKADRISYLTSHDPLTTMPNRVLAAEILTQHLMEAERNDKRVCVAMIDLVRFRRINEMLGRRAGDDLLQQVAERLRIVDPFAARLGADQFMLQLVDRRSPVDLARDFEHIAHSCFDRPFVIGNDEVRMGCRIGASVSPDDGCDAETLFRNAESALCRARTAVEAFVFYAPDMNASANEALAIESKLRRAIEREEFVLHYQPRIRFSDSRICGVEALIRWQDPDDGLVPPMRFIPVLEETGLIATVGRWALMRALRDLASWTSAGAEPVRIAVNVSPLQLNQANFTAQVAELVTGARADALELEITESVIMQDVDRKIAMLREIRALGVSISVDDFGTGYSSLAYIAKLPITSLKIDRAFVADMTVSPEGYVLVSSIIALAHALKLKVVAEGVETEEQANLLKLLSCDEAQGYLFSKPVPAARIQELLLSAASLP
jgi:diguanylate cyclase (GGDEF)-like protein